MASQELPNEGLIIQDVAGPYYLIPLADLEKYRVDERDADQIETLLRRSPSKYPVGVAVMAAGIFTLLGSVEITDDGLSRNLLQGEWGYGSLRYFDEYPSNPVMAAYREESERKRDQIEKRVLHYRKTGRTY